MIETVRYHWRKGDHTNIEITLKEKNEKQLEEQKKIIDTIFYVKVNYTNNSKDQKISNHPNNKKNKFVNNKNTRIKNTGIKKLVLFSENNKIFQFYIHPLGILYNNRNRDKNDLYITKLKNNGINK